MALSKSGKSGNNVTDLQEARKKRERQRSLESASEFPQNQAPPETADNSQQDCEGAEPDKAKSKVGNRRFDREKVDRIKGEIARGEYKIDYSEVADKFIEHDRFS